MKRMAISFWKGVALYHSHDPVAESKQMQLVYGGGHAPR